MFSRRKLGVMVLLIVSLLALSTMLAAAQQGEPDKKPPPPEVPSVANISEEEARANDGDADWPARGEVAPAAVDAFDAVTWRVQDALGVGTQAPLYHVDARRNTNGLMRIQAVTWASGTEAASELYAYATNGGVSAKAFGSGFNGIWEGGSIANWTRLRSDSTTNGLIVTTGGSKPLLFGTSDTERLRITSDGKTGVGTKTPSHQLTVRSASSDDTVRLIGPTGGYGYGARLNFGDGDYAYIGEDLDDKLYIYGSGRTAIMGGNVGVGTVDPATKLQVTGSRIRLENGTKRLDLRADGTQVDIETTTNDLYVHSTGAGNHLVLQPLSTNGFVGIRTSAPASELDVNGTTRTRVLQITGGADVAEPFSVNGSVRPGMVVAIDPSDPGQLRIADRASHRTVAGVVSGAGDIQPGLILQQENTAATGTHPVSLSGRVYVWADAGYGAIQPGDLLTTSDSAGFAMKVSDHDLAQERSWGRP